MQSMSAELRVMEAVTTNSVRASAHAAAAARYVGNVAPLPAPSSNARRDLKPVRGSRPRPPASGAATLPLPQHDSQPVTHAAGSDQAAPALSPLGGHASHAAGSGQAQL